MEATTKAGDECFKFADQLHVTCSITCMLGGRNLLWLRRSSGFGRRDIVLGKRS